MKHSKAKVVVTLVYDLDNLMEHMTDEEQEEMTEDEIISLISEDAYEDLHDLMRTDDIKYWAEITLEA